MHASVPEKLASHSEPVLEDDKELVVRSLEAPEAYRDIVQKYEASLLRYVRRLTGFDADDALDVLQETFLKAYRGLRGYDPKLGFSTWLYRIAHNEAVSALRRRKQTQPLPEDAETDGFLPEPFRIELDMAGTLDRKALLERVRLAMNRLPPKYKEVVLLRYFEEKEYSEIGDILQRPPGTVANLIHRARQKLMEELEPSSQTKES